MEAACNEALKMISTALEQLKNPQTINHESYQDIIELLERAADKLALPCST
jgi:hypothetical protein